MPERYNAVRNGDSYNCPRCYRNRSLVLVNSARAIWRCGTDGVEGCCALFVLEPSAGAERDTLVRHLPPVPARATPLDYAAKRERFQ